MLNDNKGKPFWLDNICKQNVRVFVFYNQRQLTRKLEMSQNDEVDRYHVKF